MIGRKKDVAAPRPALDVDAEEEAPVLPESKVVGIVKDELEFFLAFSLLFVEMNFYGSLSSRYEDGVPANEADHGHGDGRRHHKLVNDHVMEIGFIHGDQRADDHFGPVGECICLSTHDA